MTIRLLISNILRLNGLRSIHWRLSTKQSNTKCSEAFINQMNKKAEAIGMYRSHFINPSGLGISGTYSQSTAKDLVILGVYALKYKPLDDIWRKKEAKVHIAPSLIYKRHAEVRTIKSTIPMSTLQETNIIGGKTGSGDGYNTLLMAFDLTGSKNEGILIGSIMQATSEDSRFTAMAELIDISRSILSKQCTRKNVKCAKCACAAFIPSDNPEEVICIYEQNADEVSPPMSITKVLSTCVYLDYVKDLGDIVTVHPDDIGNLNPSGDLKKWERITAEGILEYALLRSSNIAANAMARNCGKIILSSAKTHTSI